jgi:2-dehydropantoate 2-reductase
MHWGATFEGPGVTHITSDLKHKHENNLTFFSVGEIDGSVTPRIEKIAQILSRMGKAVVTTTLMSTRWRKLTYNCCGSGMSAVCGCSYGDYLNNPKAMECLSYIGYEIGRFTVCIRNYICPHFKAYLPEYGCFDATRVAF